MGYRHNGTARHRLILIEPNERLFGNYACAGSNAVAQVESGVAFKLLLANFARTEKKRSYQVRSSPTRAPTPLLSSRHRSQWRRCSASNQFQPVCHRDPCTTNKSGINTYCKRPAHARDVRTINRHLAEDKEHHIGKEEKPMTEDDVALYIPASYHDHVWAMLRKHEKMWDGHLG